MALFGGFLGLLTFGLWVFCIFDAVTTPADQVRTLPKIAWVLIVVLLYDLGSIAWLIAGHPWGARPVSRTRPGQRLAGASLFGPRREAEVSSFGPPARTKTARPTNPDDDEEFLASLRARAEEQRRRAREAGQDDQPPG